MVRYFGYYSNACWGKRKRQKEDNADFFIEDDEYTKGCNKSWVRLIKKIYEVYSLICPKCSGSMRIIAFIEDYKVIKKYLTILGYMSLKETNPHQRCWR